MLLSGEHTRLHTYTVSWTGRHWKVQNQCKVFLNIIFLVIQPACKIKMDWAASKEGSYIKKHCSALSNSEGASADAPWRTKFNNPSRNNAATVKTCLWTEESHLHFGWLTSVAVHLRKTQDGCERGRLTHIWMHLGLTVTWATAKVDSGLSVHGLEACKLLLSSCFWS